MGGKITNLSKKTFVLKSCNVKISNTKCKVQFVTLTNRGHKQAPDPRAKTTQLMMAYGYWKTLSYSLKSHKI